MLENSLYYELMILIYGLSLLLYFMDFLQYNRKVNRIAFWLLSIVWGMQTIYLIRRGLEEGTFPLFSQFDTLFFYAWVLISLGLLTNWFLRMDFLLFFLNIIGFCVMAFSLFRLSKEMTTPLAEQLSSEWLSIHISMAFLSYAAFTISFIFSIVYVLQYQLLKKKKWNKRLQRWPSLIQLDRVSFYFNIIGTVLLLLSLIMGIVWAYHILRFPFWYDPKVVFSLCVLLLYGLYFYQRVVVGWSGKQIEDLNILCFLFLLVNYFLISFLSSFHLWY